VIVETVPGNPTEAGAEATVKMHVGGERVLATGEGNGPVNALDQALRKALLPTYPELGRFELIDFKVRIMDTQHGTDAVTRVLVETMDTGAETTWRTVGVGPNVIEASWEALVDSVVYGLVHAGATKRS
jgi:2-isopropylmalate synthase